MAPCGDALEERGDRNAKNFSKGARRLSSYPYKKILVTCARCNLRVQYDRDALLMAAATAGFRTS